MHVLSDTGSIDPVAFTAICSLLAFAIYFLLLVWAIRMGTSGTQNAVKQLVREQQRTSDELRKANQYWAHFVGTYKVEQANMNQWLAHLASLNRPQEPVETQRPMEVDPADPNE